MDGFQLSQGYRPTIKRQFYCLLKSLKEVPSIHLVNLGRMKGWVDLGTKERFRAQDPWIGNPAAWPLDKFPLSLQLMLALNISSSICSSVWNCQKFETAWNGKLFHQKFWSKIFYTFQNVCISLLLCENKFVLIDTTYMY